MRDIRCGPPQRREQPDSLASNVASRDLAHAIGALRCSQHLKQRLKVFTFGAVGVIYIASSRGVVAVGAREALADRANTR
jgi:hypothetical protein